MFSGYRIKFSLLGFVMSVLGVIFFSSLGIWQVNRALEKQALQDEVNAHQQQTALELARFNGDFAGQIYVPVNAYGKFDQQHEILIDNEIHEGKAGYHVLTPLILEDQSAILVNRGWVPLGQSRDVLPEINTPQDDVVIHGMIAPPKSKPALALTDDSVKPGKVWLFLDMQKYENITGLKLLPVVILMDKQDQYGFIREWPAYDAKIWMHVGYAIHWFVFALAVVVIYFAVNTKRISE